MKQGHGKVVTGADFFNREEEMAAFEELMEEGANLIIIAQRRMGKSSFLREYQKRQGDTGKQTCLYVDLEDCETPQDAIAALATAAAPQRDARQWLGDIFKTAAGALESLSVLEFSVQVRAGLNEGNWRAKGDAILERLAAQPKPVVIMLDELPILVSRLLRFHEEDHPAPQALQAADNFMSWLRRNSQRHQETLRFVLCGSIGLEPVLHRAGLSATINNFEPFELQPWRETTTKACLRELARHYGISLTEEGQAAVVRCLGLCIPHHVQTFFRFLKEQARKEGNQTIDADLVGAVFEKQLLGTHGQKDLVHYEERLHQVLSSGEYILALDLLSEAAIAPPLSQEKLRAFAKEAGDQDALRTVLGVLEHDGYLRKESGGYEFPSNLLRNWWAKRYGGTYIPLGQRGA